MNPSCRETHHWLSLGELKEKTMTLPHCAQAAPYGVELEEGQKYFWCTCGLSQNQPFCDGAHKGSGLKSHCFTAEVPGKVWLCGCKQSKNPPFCDGSHSKLERP